MTAYLDGYSGYSGVPEDAAAEILEKLMTHQQISSDEVAQILKRYGVCGEPEALQIAYRKKVGQRLIASLRDPYGRREVFSTGSTYVLVDCCNDRDALEHIHKKLDSLPVPALAGKLGLAVAHRNGANADQPRCADER